MKTPLALCIALCSHAALLATIGYQYANTNHAKQSIQQITPYQLVVNSVAVTAANNEQTLPKTGLHKAPLKKAKTSSHPVLKNHTHHQVTQNKQIKVFLQKLNLAIAKTLANNTFDNTQPMTMLLQCKIAKGRIVQVTLLESNANAIFNRDIIQILATVPSIKKPVLSQEITIELPLNINENTAYS